MCFAPGGADVSTGQPALSGQFLWAVAICKEWPVLGCAQFLEVLAT